MHFPGLIPLLIVLFLAFLLFGRPGRLSGLMEDLGKGIKGFRKGLGDNDAQQPPADPPRQVPDQTTTREQDRAQS
ncbi:MAG: twin-arginine translocase TatA/TatE family subunit [Hyphomonadaceae bacterium]